MKKNLSQSIFLKFVMSILTIIHLLIQMMEVTLELSDLVVMQSIHTMFCIFHKNFGNWKTSCQNLNKIIAITWRKTMEKWRNQLKLSLLKKNTYNDENAFDFRWLDVKWKTKRILLWLTWLRACKSKLMRNFFSKKSN